MTDAESWAIRIAMLARLKDRPLIVALLIGLAAQALFTWHIDRPTRIQFDEVHYVPAAQNLIDLSEPRNQEHPLVAKELIASGMMAFGDNPFGWRLVPSLFGTLTVLGVFAFLLLLFGHLRVAVIGALLTILNQMVFVQARIAMLDVFLGAFLIWGMVAMLWAMRGSGGQVLRRWLLAAVLLGLAVAVKWAAVPYVAGAGLVFLIVRLRDHWRRGKPDWRDFLSARDQPHWPGLATIPGVLILGVVSILAYFVTFLPAFFYAENPLTLARLIPFQKEMWDLQTQVLKPHIYQSSWWSWPLILRPIWYFYEWDDGAQRGVLLVGNPLIMWGGLIAVLACLVAWFRSRALKPLAIALLWVASLAVWAIIPKSLGFYYYYYLSAIFLCMAIAAAFHHYDAGRGKGREDWFVAAALLMFVYFYPILAAWPLKDDQSFHYWMWMPSWL